MPNIGNQVKSNTDFGFTSDLSEVGLKKLQSVPDHPFFYLSVNSGFIHICDFFEPTFKKKDKKRDKKAI